MKLFYLIAATLLLTTTTYAQVIEGTVKDAKTNENLPYVNVGIIGKSIGTVTDAGGRYKLDLKGHKTDTLKISMIGYQPQTFVTGSVTAGQTIALIPLTIQLNEVKVRNKKWKTGVLGIVSQSDGSNVNFGSNVLGNELGALIKIKRSPTVIKKFRAYLSSASMVDIKLRLNFYTLKGKMPDQIVQQQNIFVNIVKGQRQIEVDLDPYNVVVEDDFFVSLEWIENTRGQGLQFSGRAFRGSVYVRDASQADWEKSGWLGLGFNVDAEW